VTTPNRLIDAVAVKIVKTELRVQLNLEFKYSANPTILHTAVINVKKQCSILNIKVRHINFKSMLSFLRLFFSIKKTTKVLKIPPETDSIIATIDTM
jgi:hypothetical protein